MRVLAQESGRPAAVELVDGLLRRAHALGASDLHLDPEVDRIAARVRVDGALRPLDVFDVGIGPHLVGRVKALADLLAYRTDVPQEGRIPAARSPVGEEVRVATYPTVDGERVALRFDAGGAAGAELTLEALGLPERAHHGLRHALKQPDGVVLLTGPSGSGKTTTLYACLREIVSGGAGDDPMVRAAVTIEDPVERRVAGVTQTSVDPVAGLGFGAALRAMLRQDPDVLLVGEIRDRETARVALEAGLTGHLVLSTVHAGTAALVFARLLDMGVEPFVLATAVRGVLAQRLLRRAGEPGRCAAAEWLTVGDELRRAVLRRADGAALAAALPDDHVTLRADAARLVADGLTTQAELERVLGTD